MNEKSPLNSIVDDYSIVYAFKYRNTGRWVRNYNNIKGRSLEVPWEPYSFMNYVGPLVREGAYKIYIPNFETHNFKLSDISVKIPDEINKYIEIIDKSFKIRNRVIDYLQPIIDELGRESIDMFMFLYYLALASKYKSEVNFVNFKRIGESFSKIEYDNLSIESQMIYNEVLNLYNLYKYGLKIDSITLIPSKIGKTVPNRIWDLLDDGQFKKLSKERHGLGIMQKINTSRIKIRKIIRNIHINPYYCDYIKPTTESINVVTKSVGVDIPRLPDLSKYSRNSYNPPVVDLEKLKTSSYFTHFPKVASQFAISPVGNYFLNEFLKREIIMNAKSKKLKCDI